MMLLSLAGVAIAASWVMLVCVGISMRSAGSGVIPSRLAIKYIYIGSYWIRP